MADKNSNVQIVIGAALSSGFNTVFSGASNRIGQLGKVIKDLKATGELGAASIKKLETRYGSLIATMNARQANLNVRNGLKSQLFGVAAAASAIAFPVRSAMKFESAMADVKKVVDFSTPKGFENLRQDILSLSRTIPLTVEQLSQITAAGGQLGVKENDLLSFTTQVAKMSTAFDMSAAEAGDSMAGLSNVFQIPITQLTSLGDAINYLGNNTNARARDIIPGLARAGGVVRQFGLSAKQASAFVGTLISMKLSAEEAGSATSAMLQRLQIANKLGPKAAVAFAKLGLSEQEFPKMIANDPQGALLKFFEAAEKVDPNKRTEIFYDIFGRNYSKTAAIMTGSLAEYKRQLALVSDESSYGGSMEREFRTRAATTENSITLLKNSLSEASVTAGDPLLDSLKEVSAALQGVLNGFADFSKKNPELVASIAKVTAGLVGLKVASILTGFVFTYLKGGALALVTAFKGLRLGIALVGTALKVAFLSNPLGIILALGTSAYFVINNWEEVEEFFNKIWDDVIPYWDKFKKKMDELGVTQFITDAWNNVATILKAIWDPIKPLWDDFKKKIDELAITDKLITAWESVKTLLSDFKKKIDELAMTDKLITAWEKVKNFFVTFLNTITEKWEAFKKSISGFIGENSFIGKAISGTKNLVTSVVGKENLDKIGNSISDFKNSIGSLFDSFKEKSSLSSNGLLQAKNNNSVNDNRNYTINVTAPAGADPRQMANLVRDNISSIPTYSGVLYDKFAY